MNTPAAPLSQSRLANLAATQIFRAFQTYQQQFLAITRRAREHFERRDWRASQQDAAQRLDLYRVLLEQLLKELQALLGERSQDYLVWVSLKAVYSGLIAERDDWELAETFFNSVTRRIFATVGVNPQIEFVDTDFDAPPTPAAHPPYRKYSRYTNLTEFISDLLRDYAFAAPYENPQRDAQRVAQRIAERLQTIGALQSIERAEIALQPFFRGRGAYLVGRLYSAAHVIPFALALLHGERGIYVDAVLLEENAVSILFSFAHSYFQVEADRPYDLVRFLNAILPRKRLAELYISLGYNKHGKTELYRHFLHHLAVSDDQFEIAAGARGMVMTVFTLPSYDIVFKIIKDRFAYPKSTTRRAVMAKYRLVFKHDRAGRLIDAQEFEHLQFERSRFTLELLEELQKHAAKTVTITDKYVSIQHLYTERRLTPLDIYVAQAAPSAALSAVADYGQAMKDLAATNIFPGDLLLKNFGVTRHGRVVFYDYDELCLLHECNFRDLPQARAHDEEMSAEPWFYVGENDIFPAEFETFLGLQGDLRAEFRRLHGDLFTAAYWQNVQQRIRSGETLDIYPYETRFRLEKNG
ncbi:MAG: bifunctional isocitrate dehydrogenase kinase/phosphatase [Anaerolineales bacterium]